MWDVHPLQISGVMLWYAEEVQVIPLFVIADLKYSNHNHSIKLDRYTYKASRTGTRRTEVG